MHGKGFAGPIIGPFDELHTTYANQLKLMKDGETIEIYVNNDHNCNCIEFDGNLFDAWNIFAFDEESDEGGFSVTPMSFDEALVITENKMNGNVIEFLKEIAQDFNILGNQNYDGPAKLWLLAEEKVKNIITKLEYKEGQGDIITSLQGIAQDFNILGNQNYDGPAESWFLSEEIVKNIITKLECKKREGDKPA
ncbi:MAG: hypothetical protein HRT88_11990 [Lentisphaeraceae bacterium]|nr:hypothetical protein [Lentisphaeraceae bacterium]